MSMEKELAGEARQVMEYMASRIDHERYQPLHHGEIAEHLGIWRTQVSRSVQKLIELGLLREQKTKSKHNLYRLNPGDEVDLPSVDRPHVRGKEKGEPRKDNPVNRTGILPVDTSTFLSGEIQKVLSYLENTLSTETFSVVRQSIVAKNIGLWPAQVSRSIRELVANHFLIAGPRIGNRTLFKLNPDYRLRYQAASLTYRNHDNPLLRTGVAISAPESLLPSEAARVLFALDTILSPGEFRILHQKELAELLRMPRPQLSRAIRTLLHWGIIDKGEYQGRLATFRLSPHSQLVSPKTGPGKRTGKNPKRTQTDVQPADSNESTGIGLVSLKE